MTILTAVIIVTISSNIMLSLGMVGALSIVRYRTAVKSPLDLMFLFWAITTGIAAGRGTITSPGWLSFLWHWCSPCSGASASAGRPTCSS